MWASLQLWKRRWICVSASVTSSVQLMRQPAVLRSALLFRGAGIRPSAHARNWYRVNTRLRSQQFCFSGPRVYIPNPLGSVLEHQVSMLIFRRRDFFFFLSSTGTNEPQHLNDVFYIIPSTSQQRVLSWHANYYTLKRFNSISSIRFECQEPFLKCASTRNVARSHVIISQRRAGWDGSQRPLRSMACSNWV